LKELASYYLNIVEELNDFDEWCISEQGVWGVPIPYFTYKDSTKVLCDAQIARHFADLVRANGGTDCWYRLSVAELLPSRYKSLAPKLEKGTQVFDCWFDNSLSWDYVLKSDAHSKSPQYLDIQRTMAD
jgi:isoleucyl-tRNA synthetase